MEVEHKMYTRQQESLVATNQIKKFNKGWVKVRLLRKEMPDVEQGRIIG
jgi:hypothetical protein